MYPFDLADQLKVLKELCLPPAGEDTVAWNSAREDIIMMLNTRFLDGVAEPISSFQVVDLQSLASADQSMASADMVILEIRRLLAAVARLTNGNYCPHQDDDVVALRALYVQVVSIAFDAGLGIWEYLSSINGPNDARKELMQVLP